MASDIAGSWFPSGYYGHFRSKSRNDFVCEYRQLAKPQPPHKFLNRARQPTARHVFSNHDNRQAFLNDALIFQQGLGKKRIKNSTYQFKPEFIAWMPEREFVERTRPLVSSYRVDYKRDGTTQHAQGRTGVPQILVKRPKTSFEGVPISTYRYAHGPENPNKDVINAMNNEALKLSLLNRKNRAMTAKHSEGRESVASCMTWHYAVRSKPTEPITTATTRPAVPPATQTSEFEPQSPVEKLQLPPSQLPTPPRQPSPPMLSSLPPQPSPPMLPSPPAQPSPPMLPSPPAQPPPAITWAAPRMVECVE